jgi:protein SCO1/2
MPRAVLAVVALLGGLRGNVAEAQAVAPGTPAWAEGADVVEHLGARAPLDLRFVDASGQRVQLRSLFDGVHPVLLVLAYYECPQLCSLVLDAVVAAMRTLDQQGWKLGPQYRVATISFDATERIDQAARKQASVLAKLGAGDAAPWPFLVGDADSVRALTQRLGFSFLRDPRTGALAHAAVVFVLTPEGVISRYLYGIDYPPRDLKLALLEASEGKTGSFGDRVLMRCFEYDPATRRYGLFVSRFMKVGGLLIFLVVLAMLGGFIRYEHRRARAEGTP